MPFTFGSNFGFGHRSSVDLTQQALKTKVQQSFGIVANPNVRSPVVIGQTFDLQIEPFVQGYTPLDEGNLVAWIDVQDAAFRTLNGGGTGITGIRNKVSGVAWSLPVNNTPFEAAGLNGHPCLHPTVIGDRIQFTESAVWTPFQCTSAAKAYTFLWVVQPDLLSSSGAIFGFGNTTTSSANTQVWGQSVSTPGKFAYTTTTPALNIGATVSATATTTAVQRHCWHGPGDHHTFRINNGAPDATLNNVARSPVGMTLNQGGLFGRMDAGPDSPWAGRFGALLVYSAELGASARTRLDDFLSAQWA